MLQKEKAPILGAYHILNEIQKDAFGVLYNAVHETKKGNILLKVLSSEITQNENFTVRFELLKPLLPAIIHKNLLQTIELGQANEIFFIAYEALNYKTDNIQTLKQFDPRETPDKQQTLCTLFEGIAEGLLALEKLKDHYHKDGIIHSNLTSDQIHIHYEKSLLGKGQKLTPKIGGYFEPFLFFGEDSSSSLHARFVSKLYEWNEAKDLLEIPPIDLYSNEHFFTSDERKGELPTKQLHQFTFGALLYETIARKKPKGFFPSISEIDSKIDPKWEIITSQCLSAFSGNGFNNMSEALEMIRSLTKNQSPIAPFIKTLEEKKIPEGMSLIVFHEKVTLGSSDGPNVEQPQFKAKINPFFMDEHIVSCEQFSEFLSDYTRSSYSKGDHLPAVLTSWYMAKAYCQWRSEKEGLSINTYRLPTEYEWEAAVRGSTGEQYPWGERMESHRLWCNQSQSAGTVTVNTYPPGRFGLYNMLGNVWEWTESSFTPHPFSKHKSNIYSTKLKVVKGGCWITPTNECRATLRAAFQPNEKRGNIGFRCVREC